MRSADATGSGARQRRWLLRKFTGDQHPEHFKHIVEALQPTLVVIDSVQTLHTATLDASPGSVGQVRECTAELMRFAKTTDIPMVSIGHITKDGFIAGPKNVGTYGGLRTPVRRRSPSARTAYCVR